MPSEPPARLPPRTRGQRMAQGEGEPHLERIPPSLLAVKAYATLARRPAVGGERPVHVVEAPAGAGELQIEVVVLCMQEPLGVAADRQDGLAAHRRGRRGDL